MSIRVMSCVPAVPVGLLATVIMLGTSCATLAGDDCLAGPSRPPAQGGHWYYRVDHVNNRKCWYLVEPEARAPTALAEPQPSPEPTPQPTFGSFFSSLSSGFTRSTTATQPDTPVELKKDEAASGRQLPMARHPAAVATLAPKPHQLSRNRPPAEHADERPAPPLNQAERDALFQEFLRWKDRRTP
jgi:hypothetical protein